jgi:hypothetical protein
MGDAISGVEGPSRAVQAFGSIAVVGGGCYGRYYVRQLRRAAAAGVVTWRRLCIVDRDPHCAMSRERALLEPASGLPAPELVEATWREYFAQAIPNAAPDDAIVPSPLMPHLMVEWVLECVRARWPRRTAGLRALAAPLGVPWEMANGDAPHYASFATWTCPVNCIEPARCPHTRGPRDWSMPEVATRYVADAQSAGDALDGPLVFHCEHRAYGVGMFDTRLVREAGARVERAAEKGPAEFLIGTVSHCHGAFARLSVGPEAAEP